MALGSTQAHFLGLKAADAWDWQPHHLHVPNVMEICEPKPPGTLWATPGLLRDSIAFTFTYTIAGMFTTNMFYSWYVQYKLHIDRDASKHERP